MESLVGYESDDDVETERSHQHTSVGPSSRRREDDTNYDDVNMDLSEESQSVESEPELPPAESAPRPFRDDRRGSNDSRDKERTRDTGRDRTRDGPRDRERLRDGQRNRERDRPRDRRRDGERHERDRRSPKRDDRHNKGDRSRGSQDSRRGLLGDRPEDKSDTKMPALMDLKPYDGVPPPSARGHDARDAVSPRFAERGRRDRERERERDRDRHSRRSEERRGGRGADRTDRSRSRGAAFPPPQAMCSNDRDRRGSPPSGDYRPSSYKVNRKLEVMEKMGLQIKIPDGSMATAQQLRAAASEAPSGLPPYYNPAAVTSNKALNQKRKLLWSHKEKSESGAACWSGARFSQDADGRQVSKFMRLMGIKDPAATATKPEAPEADPNKKQEELFQAMQAQYEESQSVESEPELPPAESAPRPFRDDRRGSNDSRDKERTRDTGRDRTRDGPRDRERLRDGQRNRERDRPRDRRRDGERHERDRRSPKRDDRHNKGDRSRGSQDSRRGLLGDRPEDKSDTKMPALMDLKPYDGVPPPSARGHDARDAVSPRFAERGRRDRERERERDRDRHSRRSEERRGGRGADRTDRSRSRGAAFPPPQAMCSNDRDRRGSPPSGDYRPSSYKVNRKLEVMEKMGLQIKIPDGSMATAQQLRAAASEAPSGLPPYYNPAAVTSNKALNQKRKLLWSHKEKSESGAACWSGARFSQDADGRQVSKFMRLMGIKDPAATATKPEAPEADPNKKQEELFQAMQAQYEVARATTHTMRGVGLGFQRGNF